MSDLPQDTSAGRHIEETSFALIDSLVASEVGPHRFPPDEWQVVRRVIHATADLEFARALSFGNGAVAAGVAALRRGAPVVCDVRMIAAGISRARLARSGSEVHCLVAEPEVARAAAATQTRTRSAEAMALAQRRGLLDGAVVAIGNAPTALAEVQRLVTEQGAAPALVIGVPVGFVGAAEAKEAALALSLPYIVARGRKGGTPAAVAVVHALLALAAQEGP